MSAYVQLYRLLEIKLKLHKKGAEYKQNKKSEFHLTFWDSMNNILVLRKNHFLLNTNAYKIGKGHNV